MILRLFNSNKARQAGAQHERLAQRAGRGRQGGRQLQEPGSCLGRHHDSAWQAHGPPRWISRYTHAPRREQGRDSGAFESNRSMIAQGRERIQAWYAYAICINVARRVFGARLGLWYMPLKPER
jgi:hypothetical protein